MVMAMIQPLDVTPKTKSIDFFDFFRFSSIFFYYHRLSPIVQTKSKNIDDCDQYIRCHPREEIDRFLRFSSIFFDYHRLSSILQTKSKNIDDCDQKMSPPRRNRSISSIFFDFPRFSSISSIFFDNHRLSLIFLN